MKLFRIVTLTVALLATSVGAFPKDDKPLKSPIHMAFSDTDVADIFSAISYQSRSSIYYFTKEKVKITMNSVASSAEEAVRQVSALGGLVYRKVDKYYVVASQANLRQALEAYGTCKTITLPPGQAAKAQQYIQDALPSATARAVGDKVVITAIDPDMARVDEVLEAFSKEQAAAAVISKPIHLDVLGQVEAEGLLKALYPDLTLVGREEEHGGTYVLTGVAGRIASALEILSKFDVPATRNTSNDIVYKVYELRYMGASVVVDFVKKVFTDVDAIIGLEAYSPPRANFNPLTSALSGVGGGSSGSGVTGIGSGTSPSPTGSASNSTNSGADHKYQVGDRARTVVLKGKSASVESALKLIRSLDIKPRQVVVEVSVIETTPSFAENLGLTWNVGNTQTVSESNFGATGIGFGKFTRTTPASFSATLNASITRGEGKLLAHPKVQVMDNDDADVFIGDTIYTEVSQAGSFGAQTVSVQAFNIGIILLIRPRVGPDGNISMHVNPVVSTLTAVSSSGLPQTSSREAESTVIVKDGETVVIGGLIRDDETKTISELPILSKLPIVGQLFRNRNVSKTHKDVIVSITPHIVPDPEAGK